MTICALTWSAALTGAGIVTTLPLALLLFGAAGAADTWSVTSRTTLIQTSTSLRGRISSLEQVVGAGGPDLGNFRAGALGHLTGPGTAIALGGLSCIPASLTILSTILQTCRHTINT